MGTFLSLLPLQLVVFPRPLPPSWKNFSSLGTHKFWAKLLATCSHSVPMEFRPLETSLEDLGALSAFSLNAFFPLRQ